MTSGITNIAADSPLSAAIAQRDAQTMHMVRTALSTRNIMMAYQPVMRASKQTQVAFHEGLIRVLDETGRVIPAKDFIGTIEAREEGRIIDCLALELGLQALAENPNIRLSINLSARSIGYPAWEAVLNAGLTHDETLADRLILEITETSAMSMPELVAAFMDRMHIRGITFALDDFGAGYTSIRQFKDFFFDIVKIDAAFIRNIHEDADNQVLTQALLSIAQQFDMFTVAEGVQTAEEAAYLATSGVDCVQGFYFAAPSINAPLRDTEFSKTKAV